MAEKEIHIPDRILRDFGCMNCVWKQHGQCPEGFTDVSESRADGCCDQMAKFLMDLRSSSNSLSGMEEKFMLYTQRLQAQADKTKFHELQQKHDELSKKPDKSENDKKRLSELNMAVLSYRIFWERLTTAVVKGLGRISDRESRSKDATQFKIEHVTIQQFNTLLKSAEKPLLEEGEK